ncbi:MAG: hypothetical protein H0X24_01500 [Ktedonobacterales bacterium]|nr:hypothetical protein [Ktedonobacterales bacterium]
MRYGLSLLVLCLSLLTSCAASTVTVSTAPTTTVVAATATPAAPGALNSIDWANTAYPDLCNTNGGAKVTVSNGTDPTGKNGIRLHVLDPLFGYITRTTQLDVMVPYYCIGIMDGGTGVVVLTGNASNPTVAGKLPLTAPKYPLFTVTAEAIVSQKLMLSGYSYSADAIPQCCPDVWTNDTYTWSGSAFTLTTHTAQKLGAQLYP